MIKISFITSTKLEPWPWLMVSFLLLTVMRSCFNFQYILKINLSKVIKYIYVNPLASLKHGIRNRPDVFQLLPSAYKTQNRGHSCLCPAIWV